MWTWPTHMIHHFYTLVNVKWCNKVQIIYPLPRLHIATYHNIVLKCNFNVLPILIALHFTDMVNIHGLQTVYSTIN